MSQDQAPLTTSMFHILLALADESRHGYGVLREIEERTRGGLRMGTGTLYSAIRRLEARGLIAKCAARPTCAGDDERRIYYKLTDEGGSALRAEARRLEELVGQARHKQLLPEIRG